MLWPIIKANLLLLSPLNLFLVGKRTLLGHSPCTKHLICSLFWVLYITLISWKFVTPGWTGRTLGNLCWLRAKLAFNWITPNHWPGPSRIPQPKVSNAAGSFDILPTVGSSIQTSQPRSATATKTFILERGNWLSIVFFCNTSMFILYNAKQTDSILANVIMPFQMTHYSSKAGKLDELNYLI